MLNKLFIIALTLMLQACMSQEDFVNYIEGSWEGSDGKRSWCVTYVHDYDDNRLSAEMYHKTTYPPEENTPDILTHLNGVIVVDRGPRYKSIFELTHDHNGVEIPKEDRNGQRAYYVVVSYDKDQFTYQNMKDGKKQYVTQRVADCQHWRSDFDSWLIKTQ